MLKRWKTEFLSAGAGLCALLMGYLVAASQALGWGNGQAGVSPISAS